MTKPELAKFKELLLRHRAVVTGDVTEMKKEALKTTGQDISVDHMADHGTDNYDQDFTLSLIENEQETIRLIDEALERIEGRGEFPYGDCEACAEEPKKLCKTCPRIAKSRLEYIPWARNCVEIQKAEERFGGVEVR
jgi:RNA polymerase-binding transcription factor DksA